MYRQVSIWQARTSAGFLSSYGKAAAKVCRNNRIMHASSWVRSQAKAQESNYCSSTLQYFQQIENLDTQQYQHTHPLVPIFPFLLPTLLSFSLYFLFFLESFLSIFVSSFITSSFLPYPSLLIFHSFILLSISYILSLRHSLILSIVSLSFSSSPSSNFS